MNRLSVKLHRAQELMRLPFPIPHSPFPGNAPRALP